jgi:hypothetical protein
MSKCRFCGRRISLKWSYCSYCGMLLRKRRLNRSDKVICANCSLMKARHFGLMDRLDACDNFIPSKGG